MTKAELSALAASLVGASSVKPRVIPAGERSYSNRDMYLATTDRAPARKSAEQEEHESYARYEREFERRLIESGRIG